jgi:Tfp pilus assembly protein PilF
VNYLARRRAARRRLMAEWATRAQRLSPPELAAPVPAEPAGGVDTPASRRLPFEVLDPAGPAVEPLAAPRAANGNGQRAPAPVAALDPPNGNGHVVAELPAGDGDGAPEPPGAPVGEGAAPDDPPEAPPPAEPARQDGVEEQLYQGARQAWERRDLHRAAILYRELLARAPRHVRGRNNLALVLDELGEHEQALEELDRCHAMDAASLEVRVNRSAVLAALGRYAEAERELLEVLEQEPTSGEAYFNLGLVTARRGRWDNAALHFTRAIELGASRAAAHCYLGEALNHVDDLPGALQAYQRAVELAPNNPKAYYGMGIVLDRMNRPDEAAQAYRRSRELHIR